MNKYIVARKLKNNLLTRLIGINGDLPGIYFCAY
jgi:hypothetical protein